jgi:hypothetical protein
MTDDKTEMNAFVQNLYDQKMREGKHGHYETLFHVVHQAIAAHTAKLLAGVEMPDLEQEIYQRCRRFIATDAMVAVKDISEQYAAAAALNARREALEEAKALAQQGGQPVAWQPIEIAPKYESILIYQPEFRRTTIAINDGFEWKHATHWMPLPPAPDAAAPAPQAQQPLTDEQIKAGRTEGYDAEDTPDAWDFEQGVRFAERHHGIGEKQ